MSNKNFFRIKYIKVNNIKTIENAEIKFPNCTFTDYYNNSSILGLYGQNGTGKSTIINTLLILKHIILNGSLPDDVSTRNYKTIASITSEFIIIDTDNTTFEFKYFVEFKYSPEHRKHIISNESLKYRFITLHGEKINYTNICNNVWKSKINYIYQTLKELPNANKSINPKIITKALNDLNYLYNVPSNIINNEKVIKVSNDFYDHEMTLKRQMGLVEKAYMSKHHTLNTAFMISLKMSLHLKELYNLDHTFFDKSCSRFFSYLSKQALKNSLMDFRLKAYTLFIGSMKNMLILTTDKEFTQKNGLYPIRARINKKEILMVNYDPSNKNSDKIPSKNYPMVEEAIAKIDYIINKIIPSLNIKVFKGFADNNTTTLNILVIRDGESFDLSTESTGIKRLISLISLYVEAFNNPDTILVIDELDSTIFEDLLGKLLQIFHNSAYGQLIFTSHNLRPLEVLPYEDILFTTNNPSNRFIKIRTKGNSNLRDCYLRSVTIGGLDEDITATYNSNLIEAALLKNRYEEEHDEN